LSRYHTSLLLFKCLPIKPWNWPTTCLLSIKKRFSILSSASMSKPKVKINTWICIRKSFKKTNHWKKSAANWEMKTITWSSKFIIHSQLYLKCGQIFVLTKTSLRLLAKNKSKNGKMNPNNSSKIKLFPLISQQQFVILLVQPINRLYKSTARRWLLQRRTTNYLIFQAVI